MILRNKKTGEMGIINYFDNQSIVIYPIDENWNAKGDKKYVYHSLAELNDEWEDYKEPKEYWFINEFGTPTKADFVGRETLYDKCRKNFGNYFETKEEAEKAVEKLKAIQRLKSHYIKFKLDFVKNKIDFTYRIDGTLHSSVDEERIIFEDLDLLFGGEE